MNPEDQADFTTTPHVRHESIDEGSAGQRIDNFLMRICKGVPKSHLYQILRSGQVRVNGKRANQTYRLALGDAVRIPPIRLAQRDEKSVPLGKALEVVFEDEAFLVLNKPPGKAVHGGSGVSFGVIEQLRAQRPDARFLELVHRLDRETSGLLMVAKKRAALCFLQDAMRQNQVQKRYLTLVPGRWQNPLQHIKLPLYKYEDAQGERRVRVSPEGKPSHSIVRLLGRYQGQGQVFSLLEVELKTGRTHQIRVHLAHHGFALCGDDKYGDFAKNKLWQGMGLKRMFLHATWLSAPHPQTGESQVFQAALPADLQGFLDHFEQV